MAWTLVGNIRGPAGPTGPTGATGPTGPTGVSGLNFRGAYSGTTAYAVNDGVTYLNSSYFATAAHAASDGVPPVATERGAPNAGWALLALEGAQGPTGATGPAGTPGAAGATGPAGGTGSAGARGSNWFQGHGAPGAVGGSVAGDQYLDVDSGNTYTLS